MCLEVLIGLFSIFVVWTSAFNQLTLIKLTVKKTC